MKNLVTLIAFVTLLGGSARAEFNPSSPGLVPPPRHDFECARAQQKLAQAYQSLQSAQAMANNSVAICGQSASCYVQIAAAVNINQQAVANAQQEVRWACHPGRF